MIIGIAPRNKFFVLIDNRWCLVEELTDENYYIYDLPKDDRMKFSPVVLNKNDFNNRYSNLPTKSVLQMYNTMISYYQRSSYDLNDKELLMVSSFLDTLSKLKQKALKNKNNPKYAFKKKNMLMALEYYNDGTCENRRRARLRK